MNGELKVDNGQLTATGRSQLSTSHFQWMCGWVVVMMINHQAAEAGKVGWADARKPIVKTAWAALPLSPSYKAIRAQLIGWWMP